MNCPLCLATRTTFFGTGTDFLFETTGKSFDLHSCHDCRCLFLDPMPGSEEIAGFYPKQYWWDASPGGVLRTLETKYRRLALADHVSFITRTARTTVPSGGARILDVGCGPATVLGLLKAKGFDVTGVDLSESAAEIAKRDYGIDVTVGSVQDAAFPSGEFDVVVLLHVLEHVPNPHEVLTEIFRILKPKGRIVLQVPNIDSLQFRLFGVRWYGLDVPRHLIDYSRSSVLRLLRSCGFVDERIRHFNLRDNAPALASSLFPGLDPVSRAVRLEGQNQKDSTLGSWWRRLVYLKLVIASYPFAAIEAALGRGATLMIEARKT
jgi:SAM-dependent methyltransferase